MFKKRICLSLLSVFVLCSISFPAFSADTTPFKFCFWPNASIPSTDSVRGMNMGFIDYGNSVVGVELGLFSITKYLVGGQLVFINAGGTLKGINLAALNFVKRTQGVQVGVYNDAATLASGGQIGIVNRTIDGKGMQFGLVNIMDNGFAHVFPFINFPKNWFK